MILAPAVALGFGSAAFFPVAITSAFGGLVCLLAQTRNGRVSPGRIAAALVIDLAYADARRRELVLSELSEKERKWFEREVRKRAL